jgi:hypothetical protein
MRDEFGLSPRPHGARRRLPQRLRKSLAAFAVTTLFLAGGVALAAWTASTTNQHAEGKYGTLQAVVMVTPNPGTADLYPNSKGSLYVRFSNPNPQAVTVASIDGSSPTFSGCTTPDAALVGFDVSGPNGSLYTNGGAGWSVPGGSNGVLDVTIANAVQIGANASDDCQGATLDVGGLAVNTTT